MKLKPLLIIFAVVLLFVGDSLSQPVSIRTAEGYLFIQNGQNISFACEVRGKEIKAGTAAGNPSFTADGNLIQILSVKNSDFDIGGKTDVAKLLELHRDWETDYLKTIFSTAITAESEKIKLGDWDFLFWSFRRPKYTVEFDRDAYVTTLIGRDIFGINSPVRVGEGLEVAKEGLLSVMRTLKTSKTPYNIEEIAAAIRKGENPKL